MNDILYELFTNSYDTTLKLDKKQRELAQQAANEWKKIEKALGRKFVDHLAELEGELEDWQHFQYYRSGFLLALRLMLEVLGTTSG